MEQHHISYGCKVYNLNIKTKLDDKNALCFKCYAIIPQAKSYASVN